MEKVKEFIRNLTEEDIYLVGKLDYMYEAEIQNHILWNILYTNDELQTQVFLSMKQILNEDLEEWSKLIKEETEHLYDIGCINKKEDFSSGLYYLTNLYLDSINRALSLGYDITIY